MSNDDIKIIELDANDIDWSEMWVDSVKSNFNAIKPIEVSSNYAEARIISHRNQMEVCRLRDEVEYLRYLVDKLKSTNKKLQKRNEELNKCSRFELMEV